ncbi:MAG: hypothetical protein KJP00_06095, partial [Bacteroidia bacterium]|nr:hypothetical protein [Bacteroidia bacterium]
MIRQFGKCASMLVLLLVTVVGIQAQSSNKGWHLEAEGNGIAIQKAYDYLGQSPSQPIIVAVIDGGVDADHEDLQYNMWVNQDEIPGNGIDDDKNGYIDDINGWSFIGGKDGDVGQDNLEITRLYKKYMMQFKNADIAKMSKKERREYDKYLDIKKKVENRKDEADGMYKQMEFTKTMLENAARGLEQVLKDEGLNFKDLNKIKSNDQNAIIAINVIQQLENQGLEINSLNDLNDAITNEIGGAVDYYKSQSLYHYNPDYD